MCQPNENLLQRGECRAASSEVSKSEVESDVKSTESNDSLSLMAEVQSLRKHKEWADKKIDQLIKRVRDSEGPQRLLTEEVQQLRLVSFQQTKGLR